MEKMESQASAGGGDLFRQQSNQTLETATKTIASTSSKRTYKSAAERYKEQLRNMTPEERNLQRLEWKWNRRKEKWTKAAINVQRRYRGYRSRRKIQKFKVQRRVIIAVENIIKEGLTYVPFGKYDEALRIINKAWDLKPGYFGTHRARAYVLFKARRPAEARADCDLFFRQHAIPDEFYDQERPTDYEVHRLRGKCALALRDWAGAAGDLGAVLEGYGADEEAHFLRSIAYFKLHQYDEAVVDLSRNIELHQGGDALAYLHRAAMYSCMKKWEEALLDYSLALKLEPSAFAYTMRARVYTCMREWRRAERDYEAALKLDPEDGEARIGLEQARIPHVRLPLVAS